MHWLLCLKVMIVSWLFIGVVSAIAFLAFIQLKPAQEPQILAMGLILAALIYVGFAIVGNARLGWIAIELVGVGLYGLLAVIGLYFSQWWLMLGWVAHPVWDISLHWFAQGTIVTPISYAIICTSFDGLVAAYIANKLLKLSKLRRQRHET